MPDSKSELLAPYPGPWDERAAAHLLNRVAFGAPVDRVEALMKETPDSALKRFLYFESVADNWQKPEWAEPPKEDFIPPFLMTQDEKKQKQREQGQHARELQTWWLHRMAQTTRPLQEKLALFWHGHFATSLDKVKAPYMMWMQNETLRRNASGNFRTMVMEISRDPAMIQWLDNDSNRKEKPNENYARELMELFTLGEGHYTENDIKESARAFTGWGLQKRQQQYQFTPKQHDSGDKIFMGKTGPWDGGDIVNIIFDQPQCARFIVTKLWNYFAYENPEPEVLDGLSEILRKNNYELKPLLWKMLSCRAFYSDRSVRTQIKSPVQLVVGSYQVLQQEVPQAEGFSRLLINILRLMGQEPFRPPNVKGWDGGLTWVTTSSLLLRYNFADFLVHGVPPQSAIGNVKAGKGKKKPVDPAQLERIRRNAKTLPLVSLYDPAAMASSEQVVKSLGRILWNAQPDAESFAQFTKFLDSNDAGEMVAFQPSNPNAEQKVRDLIHLMMSTPQYQLC